jgi:hypothetical protein
VDLPTLWQECSVEVSATRFIQRKSKPFIPPDEFVNALYLYSYNNWYKFDPLKGDASKSLEEQFRAWMHWQMRGARTELCRQLYAQYKWGVAGGLETKKFQIDGLDDVELDVERLCHKNWLLAYFEVEVEEVDNLDVIKDVLGNIIKLFKPCKDKHLRYQAIILEWMLDKARTENRVPEVKECAEALEISEWSAYKAWEAVQNQIIQQLRKAGINGLVSRQIA